MYLSCEINRWFASSQGWSEVENWKNPYATIAHAENILGGIVNDHHRADVVVNLKRAIDSRVRHLDELYRFKRLPLPKDVTGIYDRLCYLGIIRPKMFSKLYELRNAIEHRDEPAPDTNRCHELLEFAWYFLKSTDSIARSLVGEVLLYASEETTDEGYWLEVSFTDPNRIKFRGWMPPELVSHAAKAGWYEVEMERCETKLEVKNQSAVPSTFDQGRRLKDEDLCVNGVFVGEDSKSEMLRIYFQQ